MASHLKRGGNTFTLYTSDRPVETGAIAMYEVNREYATTNITLLKTLTSLLLIFRGRI